MIGASAGTLDVAILPVAILAYGCAAIAYGLLWRRRAGWIRATATSAMSVGLGVSLFQLSYRWATIGQPPFKTLYESLILLAACLAIVYLVVEASYRVRVLGLPASLACLGTATYALFQIQKEAVNLPAALQSGWFVPHVVVYFFGYAALFAGFAAGLLFVIRPAPIRLGREDLTGSAQVDVERFMHGAVRFSFVLLTVGLLMGAFWAKSAWGDYWVWDPKETWSLVSWLIVGVYMHLRFVGGWTGRRLAFVVIAGFAAVMFTYLGMNLLPTAESSLHVYQ